MAAQRLYIATVGGTAADEIVRLFLSWRVTPDKVAIDRFCAALPENANVLPIIYYNEWIDRWLMGNQIPGPVVVDGERFQISCFSCDEAIDWANRCGHQYQEQEWLAVRLREAASAWSNSVTQVVVVVREVFDISTSDEEIQASFAMLPAWLSSL